MPDVDESKGFNNQTKSSLEHLVKYAGKYWFNVSKNEQNVISRLKKLLGSNYDYYMMLNDTQSPIDLEQVNGYKFVIVDGWYPHNTSKQCVILFDILNNEIHVGVSDEVTVGKEPETHFFHEGHPNIVQYSLLWKKYLCF
jgi:hypothetical protein